MCRRRSRSCRPTSFARRWPCRARRRSPSQHAALYGLGGVGKTALAIEHAYREIERYPGGIWWLVAEGDPLGGMVRLSDVLRAIAPPEVRAVLEALPREAPAEELARATKLALQNQRAPSLLVLDNVDRAG